MGVLTSELFTKTPNQALELCAEKDAHHIIWRLRREARRDRDQPHSPGRQAGAE